MGLSAAALDKISLSCINCIILLRLCVQTYMREVIHMAAITQTELNAIRECVASHKTASSKLSAYAQQCGDPQIKKMFEQAATDADKGAQNLLQML